MSLIRTQGLLTTDKVPQWGREKILRKKNSRPRSNGYDSKTKRDPTAKNVVFHKTKMALYCPQGSGTLRQQLLSMHGIAWYCMVLHGIAWYCMVLHGIAWYCMILHGIAWYCMVLHGIALYCMVLHGVAWWCMVLHCIA